MIEFGLYAIAAAMIFGMLSHEANMWAALHHTPRAIALQERKVTRALQRFINWLESFGPATTRKETNNG